MSANLPKAVEFNSLIGGTHIFSRKKEFSENYNILVTHEKHLTQNLCFCL